MKNIINLMLVRIGAFRLPENGRLFQMFLLAATYFPLLIYIISQNYVGIFTPLVLWSVTLIGTVSGAHVFLSLYLLINSNNTVGVPWPILNLVVIPLFIISINIFIITFCSLFFVMLFMLFYIHYAMWHFGRQNLGVVTFSTNISMRRPMLKFERTTIMFGVLAGVLGSYSVFSPALMLSPKLFPFDTLFVEKIFYFSKIFGWIVYAVLTPIVLIYVIRNHRGFDISSLLLYLGSVFFFLPIYVSQNQIYTLASYTTAHGLQYIVFLLFHAIVKSRDPKRGPPDLRSVVSRWRFFSYIRSFAPLLTLIAVYISAITVWDLAAGFQNGTTSLFDWFVEKEILMKTAFGLILGITMAHYWVDQKLWKFQNKERRKWLSDSYPFLFRQQ